MKNTFLEKLVDLFIKKNYTKEQEPEFCPQNCGYLIPNEKKQDKIKKEENRIVKHECIFWKVTLKHGLYHPNIIMHEPCMIQTKKKERTNDR